MGVPSFQLSVISGRKLPAHLDIVHSLIVRRRQEIIRNMQVENPSAVSRMPGFVFGVAKLLQVAAVALGFACHADRATVMDKLM